MRPDAVASAEEDRERPERLEPLDFFAQAPSRGNVIDFPSPMKLIRVGTNPFGLDTLPPIEAASQFFGSNYTAAAHVSSARKTAEPSTQPEDESDDLLARLLESMSGGKDSETPTPSSSQTGNNPDPVDPIDRDPGPVTNNPDPDTETDGGDPEEPRRGNRAPTVGGQNRLNDVMMAQVVLIGLSELLMNAEDADGDELTVTDVSVSSGSVVAHEAFWIYTPQPGHLGEVRVTYSVSDGLETVAHSANFNVVDTIPIIPRGTATLGDDWLVGTADADVFDGLAGHDTIETLEGNDVIRAGDGNDTLNAGSGDDIVFAGGGNDAVNAGDGNDEVHGEEGDDTLFGEAGDDTLDGDAGDDQISGGSGDDMARGGAGRDIVQGDDGQDTLHGGDGGDMLAGGDGDDDIAGDADDDTLYGDAGNDALDGGEGDDSLFGGDGDDSVLASLGADFVEGGAGRDIVQGEDGNDSLHGGADDDIVSGGQGDDTVAGDEGQDTLYGDAGNDVLDGGDGDDSIFAGDGADTVAGDDGSDYIDSEDGDDVIDAGAGVDIVFAGSGNDEIAGGDGADVIDAGDGADTVSAGSDNDLIIVTLDADGDVYNGGDGVDALDMSQTNSGVAVDLINGTVSSAEIGTDVVSGFERIIGGFGNDTFQAGGQSTTFAGAAGNDTFTFAMSATSGIAAGQLVHEIIDFMVGDRVMVEQFEISDTARDAAEDLFSRVYDGQSNGGSAVPIRIRYERFDDMDHTVIDVDFDLNNEFEMSIDIYGHHTPYVYNTVA
ncbi:calcium-binding protein [Neomesorhizobium albiziae]|uniref:calcium-binding protein n=1 Tax=Neomesorhizobium albiziae TaxID=335020 RepID=UPI001FCEFCA2|nr:cadherin-like domain-containing protein [Mesorhizobium albiziae]